VDGKPSENQNLVSSAMLYLMAWRLGWISGRAVYDCFSSILTLCSVSGLVACGIL
jgi:hypothetical protein